MAILIDVLPLLLPALTLLGLLHAIDAVMRARTPQGATAWAISLVAIPYLTIPLYWIFGRSKFHEYVEMLREVQSRRRDDLHRVRQEAAVSAVVLPQSVPFSQTLLESLAEFPFSRGNAVRLHIDGQVAFPAIFKALESAQRYILLQSYIVRDDAVGRELKQILTERARAGVRVCMLIDSVGGIDLSSEYIDDLRAAGVEVEFFRAGRRWFLSRFELNFRNHRKTVLVDGEVGFLGGLNFGDEYRGPSERFAYWRDTHLELKGPALIQQQIAFGADWLWVTGRDLAGTLPTATIQPQDQTVLLLPSGPSDRHETASLLFNHLISSARRRVWIATPYAVPDSAVMSALKMAVLRGVEVRLLIPDTADHHMVYLANFGFCAEAAEAGVKVHRYTKGFMHQKVALVDDEVAVVGSANFDNRSFRLNFELSAVIVDRSFAAEVEAMLEVDFSGAAIFDSEAYARSPFYFRALVQMARLFSPVL